MTGLPEVEAFIREDLDERFADVFDVAHDEYASAHASSLRPRRAWPS
jgi:hypothetical protein